MKQKNNRLKGPFQVIAINSMHNLNGYSTENTGNSVLSHQLP